MALNERQNFIFKFLKENKSASVSALAKLLYVSDATIRRDLQELQIMGLVERNHGGAILPETADEVSIFFRMQKNAKEKEILATKALPILPKFQSVFLDSSSTVLALAQRMDLRFKTVVTNGLQTALELSKKADVNVVLLGGNIQYNTNSATGSFAIRQLELIRFDLMICSCASVTGEECLERSIEQAELKRTAFLRCNKRILLFDHTKFSAFGTYSTVNVSSFDVIVTDKKPIKNLQLKTAKLIY